MLESQAIFMYMLAARTADHPVSRQVTTLTTS